MTSILRNRTNIKLKRIELRNQLTPAEASFWNMVKSSRLDGRKFRRQHSVGCYILDFYCPSECIAVELDGKSHFEISQHEKDQRRDSFLLERGIKVVRIENKFIFKHPEGVLEMIRREFGWNMK